MGVYVGPAPITVDDILSEYYRAPCSEDSYWEIGAWMWPRVLQLRYGNGEYLIPPISSLGTAVPFKLLGLLIRITDDPAALRLVRPGAATGATERLPRVCRECADVLPDGAEFCIKCGAPV